MKKQEAIMNGGPKHNFATFVKDDQEAVSYHGVGEQHNYTQRRVNGIAILDSAKRRVLDFVLTQRNK